MSKLLKVESTDQEVQGIDGRVFTIRVAVINPNNLSMPYDRYVSTSDIANKASQNQLHSSMHKMLDEALKVLFND